MLLFLPNSLTKTAGLAVVGAAGYVLYKSGILRPAAVEVLKAGYRVKAWANAKAKATAKTTTRSPRKRPMKREGPGEKTATAQVLDMVKASKKGVTASMLAHKTGFERKKIRDILGRAYKQGKIKRAARAVYVWA